MLKKIDEVLKLKGNSLLLQPDFKAFEFCYNYLYTKILKSKYCNLS